MKQILCIEDNAEMRILVESALDEFKVQFASTLEHARVYLANEVFSLILLDLGLPDGDGLKFLTELSGHSRQRETPIFILSAKGETANKVMAFSVGAEDFITKPFDPQELKARVLAKLRKVERVLEKAEVLRVGDLQIDIPKQRIWIQSESGAEEVNLTSLEFRLLMVLARNPERIYSRDYLLDEVWGNKVNVTDRTVDAHIGHIRKKLNTSKCKIDTVVGAGYRFMK